MPPAQQVHCGGRIFLCKLKLQRANRVGCRPWGGQDVRAGRPGCDKVTRRRHSPNDTLVRRALRNRSSRGWSGGVVCLRGFRFFAVTGTVFCSFWMDFRVLAMCSSSVKHSGESIPGGMPGRIDEPIECCPNQSPDLAGGKPEPRGDLLPSASSRQLCHNPPVAVQPRKAALQGCQALGYGLLGNPEDTSYFCLREAILPVKVSRQRHIDGNFVQQRSRVVKTTGRIA